VIDVETTLLQQFLNIAQRQRIAKTPPYRTNNEAGFGLTPFEDRGSGYHFAILSRHQPAALKVATHPFRMTKIAHFSDKEAIFRTAPPYWIGCSWRCSITRTSGNARNRASFRKQDRFQ
jgi:hypothetical protein